MLHVELRTVYKGPLCCTRVNTDSSILHVIVAVLDRGSYNVLCTQSELPKQGCKDDNSCPQTNSVGLSGEPNTVAQNEHFPSVDAENSRRLNSVSLFPRSRLPELTGELTYLLTYESTGEDLREMPGSTHDPVSANPY